MVSNISDTDNIQLLMSQLYQKIEPADTDGTKGLSQNELLSADAIDDAAASVFLKSLKEQFDILDTDANGQLTVDEVSQVKLPDGLLGPPPWLSMEFNENTAASDKTALSGLNSLGSIFDNMSGSFIDKLLNSYKNGSLSNLISSLNIAI